MAATMVSINGIFPWLCVLISAVMAKATLPYSLGVRDSLMIAHSFHGNSNFGPAGGMVRFVLWPLAVEDPRKVCAHTVSI